MQVSVYMFRVCNMKDLQLSFHCSTLWQIKNKWTLNLDYDPTGYSTYMVDTLIPCWHSQSKPRWTCTFNTSIRTHLDEPVQYTGKPGLEISSASWTYLCGWESAVMSGGGVWGRWLDGKLQNELKLVWKLHPLLSWSNPLLPSSVSVEKRVAAAAHLFGISTATVCQRVYQVTRARMYVFGHYTELPKGQRLRVVMIGFEEWWRFPQCAGAVDGTHIAMIAPEHNVTAYFNREASSCCWPPV